MGVSLALPVRVPVCVCICVCMPVYLFARPLITTSVKAPVVGRNVSPEHYRIFDLLVT